MRFSPLVAKIPDYPFRKVGQISREAEQRDGVRVINARIGIPDKEAPPSIKQAMARFMLQANSTLGYPCDTHPERGIPEFIEAIIEDYRQQYGVALKPENVAATGWNKEVLHNLVRLFAPGTVCIPDPVYPAYEPAAVLAGHKVQRVRTTAATNWLPEFRFKQAAEKPVAFYFCDPNNPTGATANRAFYQSLLEEMQGTDISGIFDKAYKNYTFDNKTKPISITQIPGMLDKGFELVSLSKHYNFVGIGLGWMVSSEENINRWFKLSSQYSQGVEWYKQKTGVEALRSPAVKAEMQAYFKEVKERRDIFTKGLQELGLMVAVSQTTPYLWIKVPEGYDDERFVLETLINKAHVAFMPGSYFGENGRGYMRATLFLAKKEIEEVLDRIKKIKTW
jgi:aspartate/methionine/tyrosine aminotransferase